MVWKKGSLPTSFSRTHVYGIGIGNISQIAKIQCSFIFPYDARRSKKDVLAHKLLRMLLYDTHFVHLSSSSSSLFHSHASLMDYKNPMQIFKKKKSPNDAEKWKKNTFREIGALVQEVNGKWGKSEWASRRDRVRMKRHEWKSNYHPAVISNRQKWMLKLSSSFLSTFLLLLLLNRSNGSCTRSLSPSKNNTFKEQ